jgi:hypothetical protein
VVQKSDLAGKTMRHAALFNMRHKFGYAACGITKYPGLRRNLLGREGWLRHLQLALIDYENTLHLSQYS